MTKAKITAAGKQYKKVYKLRGDLTKAQKKTLRVSKSRIAAIKQMVAVNTEIKAVLKDKRVIKDLTYSDDALQQTLTGLKSKYAKFVSQKQDDATLIHNEVAAIAKVKSSTTGDPDQAKIDAAKTAVDAIPVAAFKAFWSPKIPTIENGKLVAKESLTAGTDKVSATVTQETSAAAKSSSASAPAASSSAKASQAAKTTTKSTQATTTKPSTPAASASHSTTTSRPTTTTPSHSTTTTTKPSTGSSTGTSHTTTPSKPSSSSSSTKPTEPVKKPHVLEPGEYIGNGGLLSSMSAAMAAMNKALDDAADAGQGRQAHAFSVSYQDGTTFYSWEWSD
ncbi:hypothetical protein [Lacticaseibacillus camelliae]|uniref:Uncharacterized protein n=1 Tax=Lacticaseibacillus camelliae DSM 22697 = JCM 13995 TaxID=1423730 RepID=A0A0R2FI47_9LACO|nr:hypothetical protein [Lacticaseibacillus camelliae]KRN24141.1 hypothetical protein FC75_GL001319 [Lacticaseibacillus camelliae DSM 22697 = JCM 13995]